MIASCGILSAIHVRACDIEISDYAEPENVVKVYDYKSVTAAALPEMKFDDFIGSYTYTPVRSEVKNNVKTLTVNVTGAGLPDYFPSDYPILFSEKTGDGYYSSEFDDTGKETEHLVFPDCVAVGSHWEPSTFWDKEEIVSLGGVEVSAGRFENCITIKGTATERTDASKKVGERQTILSIRCPGIGLVSTTMTNTITAVNFQTVTTMKLKSFHSLE